MGKTVWIWNHYATNMFFDEGGRHYWFAHYLIKAGYEPTIFCASTIHNSEHFVDTNGLIFRRDVKNNIPFVFVKTPLYKGNGKSRIMNMLTFYRRMFSTAKKYAEKYGKPDIILASSVHPLTLVAGIKIAKKFGVPCICEVRDLWPESLVAYGSLKRNSLLARLLYRGERWIYKKAEALIFTVEGGKDYIREQKWDIENGGPINLDKVHHINNGVDLDTFEMNAKENSLNDSDLKDQKTFKVIYTGSIREVNNVRVLVEAAKYIKEKSVEKIRFIIYGDGDKKDELLDWCETNGIDNVCFKGRVDKRYIPYVLNKSDLNVLHFEQSTIKKYGISMNKLFDYFASGKPTISDCEAGYDIVNRYNAGLSEDFIDPHELADTILLFLNMSEKDYIQYCTNAKRASREYDYKTLTQKLVAILQIIEKQTISRT